MCHLLLPSHPLFFPPSPHPTLLLSFSPSLLPSLPFPLPPFLPPSLHPPSLHPSLPPPFQCCMCHLAMGDGVATRSKLEEFKNVDYSFASSRECTFLEQLLNVRTYIHTSTTLFNKKFKICSNFLLLNFFTPDFILETFNCFSFFSIFSYFRNFLSVSSYLRI